MAPGRAAVFDLADYEWPSALVTGAGSGLGRELTRAFTAAGVDVIAVGRRMPSLLDTQRVCEGARGQVRPVECDISDAVAVKSMFEDLGASAPGLLVNAAGRANIELAEDITEESWRRVLSTTLDGTFHVLSAWGRARLKAGGIALNVTSATVGGGSASTAHSGAAKSGIESLTKSLAVEWARYGIRVNAIAPGPFLTEAARRLAWADDAQVGYLTQKIPLGRVATIEEVLHPCLFLMSRFSSYVNGEVLKVDGGWTLNGWLYMPSSEVPRPEKAPHP